MFGEIGFDHLTKEERLAKLHIVLHALETRVPRILLQKVEEIYPKIVLHKAEELYPSLREQWNITLYLDKYDSKRNAQRACKSAYSNREFQQKCTMKQEYTEPIIPRDSYKCKICKLNCESRSSYVVHMRVHTGERPFSCKHCKKTFSQSGNYNKHIRLRYCTRMYTCKICSSTFMNHHVFLEHYRVHAENQLNTIKRETPYACEICKKTFSSPKCVKLHAYVHNQPYSCKICNRNFSFIASLEAHTRSHIKNKLI